MRTDLASPVFCSVESSPLKPGSLLSHAPNVLEKDWFGALVSPPIEVLFALDPEALWLGARRRARAVCDQTLAPGTFREGLWEREVVEVFVCENVHESTRYQEFNLSPAGAWWTCRFSDYRVRETGNDAALRLSSGIQCWSSLDPQSHEDSWSVTMRMPRENFYHFLDFDRPWRANLTAVVIEGDKSRYLSATSFSKKTPDFHLASEFAVVSTTKGV